MFQHAPLEDWYRTRYFADSLDISGSGVADYSYRQLRDVAGLTLEQLDEIIFHDNPTFGDEANRRLIASRWGDGDWHKVITSNGSNEALSLLMHAILKPGDEVVSLFPCYHCHDKIALHLGCTVKYWYLAFERQYRPDFTQLASLLSSKTKLVVVNFPHNPTGTSLTIAEMKLLVDMVDSVGAYLIWDAAFQDLQFQDPLPSIHQLYDKAISTNTFSKAYGFPGMRYGWCIVPPSLIRPIQLYKDFTNLYVSPVIERLAGAVLQNLELFYQPRYQQAAENRQLMLSWLAEHKAVLEWVVPYGGVTCFPRLRHLADTRVFCEQLFEQFQVLLVPGDCFGSPGHFRMGYGANTDVFRSGLARLTTGLQALV
jgi:capreomycidine synthase